MQKLVFRKKNTLEWIETSKKQITSKNSAIVTPLAIARCDLDLPIVRGETLFRPPFSIGHEFVGKVVDISEDQKDRFKIGDYVAVAFQISCGNCPSCISQYSNSCETVPYTSAYGMPPGSTSFGGAVADEVLVPFADQMMVKLPESIHPVDIASFSDNIAEVWKLAGQFLKRKKDPKVLVVGGLARSISIYTALFLTQTKQAEVVYVDTNKESIDMTERIGIQSEHLTSFPKPTKKYDIVVDCSATKEGWTFASRSLGKNSILSSASIFWTNALEIPYLEMYNQGAEIHVSRVSSKESMVSVLPYIASGEFTPGKVVTKIAKFEDAKEAWLEESTKLVVVKE